MVVAVYLKIKDSSTLLKHEIGCTQRSSLSAVTVIAYERMELQWCIS